jgi:hypothetical protein
MKPSACSPCPGIETAHVSTSARAMDGEGVGSYHNPPPCQTPYPIVQWPLRLSVASRPSSATCRKILACASSDRIALPTSVSVRERLSILSEPRHTIDGSLVIQRRSVYGRGQGRPDAGLHARLHRKAPYRATTFLRQRRFPQCGAQVQHNLALMCHVTAGQVASAKCVPCAH